MRQGALKTVLAALLLSACNSATDAGTSMLRLTGEWSYTTSQVRPAFTVTGTLRIVSMSGRTFTGSAELTETDAQGVTRQRVAELRGQVVAGSDDVVDFDLFIDQVTRRHVARVAADSMSGSWAVTTGPSASGSFRARKL